MVVIILHAIVIGVVSEWEVEGDLIYVGVKIEYEDN